MTPREADLVQKAIAIAWARDSKALSIIIRMLTEASGKVETTV